MGPGNMKEVKFAVWCPRCEHYESLGHLDPCNDCLSVPAREGTAKPERWKETNDADKPAETTQTNKWTPCGDDIYTRNIGEE